MQSSMLLAMCCLSICRVMSMSMSMSKMSMSMSMSDYGKPIIAPMLCYTRMIDFLFVVPSALLCVRVYCCSLCAAQLHNNCQLDMLWLIGLFNSFMLHAMCLCIDISALSARFYLLLSVRAHAVRFCAAQLHNLTISICLFDKFWSIAQLFHLQHGMCLRMNDYLACLFFSACVRACVCVCACVRACCLS